jgi:O-antigen/teichoic acid export membrane protein
MSNSNYKQSFKSFSILGSIQVLVMLINIARTKIVAVLLGASGVGMLGLFQTTIDLICAISNMGFGTSSVRNVSEANSGNKTKLYHVGECKLNCVKLQ